MLIYLTIINKEMKKKKYLQVCKDQVDFIFENNSITKTK